MRETVGDWKKEWIETNGLTNELEVIIKDNNSKNQIRGLMKEPICLRGALPKYQMNCLIKK